LKHAGWISGTAMDWPGHGDSDSDLPLPQVLRAEPNAFFPAFQNRAVAFRLHDGWYRGHLMKLASSQGWQAIRQVEIHVLRGNTSVACLLMSAKIFRELRDVHPSEGAGQIEVKFEQVDAGQSGPLISPMAAD
jgi:hypothetical protein